MKECYHLTKTSNTISSRIRFDSLTAVNRKTAVSRYVTVCTLVDPEDGSCIILLNITKLVAVYKASHSRRQLSSTQFYFK
jgi:hypothetical protein